MSVLHSLDGCERDCPPPRSLFDHCVKCPGDGLVPGSSGGHGAVRYKLVTGVEPRLGFELSSISIPALPYLWPALGAEVYHHTNLCTRFLPSWVYNCALFISLVRDFDLGLPVFETPE